MKKLLFVYMAVLTASSSFSQGLSPKSDTLIVKGAKYAIYRSSPATSQYFIQSHGGEDLIEDHVLYTLDYVLLNSLRL